MTAAQIKARANFKKAIAYRTKTGCSLKEAFAHVKGSKVTGVKKAAKKKVLKKSAQKSGHKDNKSHNVNIKVVSGWKKGSTNFREKDKGKIKNSKNYKVSRTPKGSLYKAGTFAKFSKLAEMFDISAINDLDQLKKQYFKLVKIYHPDAGGTNEQFVKLKDEYDKLRDKILKGSKLSDEEQKNEIVIDEALQTIVDNIINIDDIIIEVIGKWIWVSSILAGFSNSSYALLKKAGLTYIKKGGKPYMIYKGVESKSRGGMAKEDIEKKYGKTKFEPRKGNKLNGIIKNKAKILAAFNRLKKGLDKRPV